MTAPPAPERTEAAQRILQAAQALFAERGYQGVSIRDIASAAGISKANVFHHFASKLELYQAVLEHCSDDLRGLLEGFAQSTGPLPERLGSLGERHLSQMLERPGATQLLLRELLDTSSDENRAVLTRVVESNFGLATGAFAELQRQGALNPAIDPQVLAMTVFGSHLAFFLLRGQLPRAPQDAESYNQALLTLLSERLLGDDGQHR